jgi:hypothetical protein
MAEITTRYQLGTADVVISTRAPLAEDAAGSAPKRMICTRHRPLLAI